MHLHGALDANEHLDIYETSTKFGLDIALSFQLKAHALDADKFSRRVILCSRRSLILTLLPLNHNIWLHTVLVWLCFVVDRHNKSPLSVRVTFFALAQWYEHANINEANPGNMTERITWIHCEWYQQDIARCYKKSVHIYGIPCFL